MEFAAIAVVWTLLLVVAWTAVGRSLAHPTRLDAAADRHDSDPSALRAAGDESTGEQTRADR